MCFSNSALNFAYSSKLLFCVYLDFTLIIQPGNADYFVCVLAVKADFSIVFLEMAPVPLVFLELLPPPYEFVDDFSFTKYFLSLSKVPLTLSLSSFSFVPSRYSSEFSEIEFWKSFC